ncbi:MAG: hypothetical protein ACXAEU_18240 [Candidatus Hodarchaeales archaeon]|jgi:hypothetical protein
MTDPDKGEESNISLENDILSAIKSLEMAKEKDSTPKTCEDVTTGPMSSSATSMSITKDPWELLDQGIDLGTSRKEIRKIWNGTTDIRLRIEEKLPKECTKEELYENAISDLTSIIESTK